VRGIAATVRIAEHEKDHEAGNQRAARDPVAATEAPTVERGAESQ
jgi:hypothetical protein